MRRIIIATLVVLGVSLFGGEVSARDAKGMYRIVNEISCGKYLDAYSRSTLTGARTFSGPHEIWESHGWIDGYITAYNAWMVNGKQNILDGMPINR